MELVLRRSTERLWSGKRSNAENLERGAKFRNVLTRRKGPPAQKQVELFLEIERNFLQCGSSLKSLFFQQTQAVLVP